MILLRGDRTFYQDPLIHSVTNIKGHVILHCENRSFHQHRPPRHFVEHIRGHVILLCENRSCHQDRPPQTIR